MNRQWNYWVTYVIAFAFFILAFFLAPLLDRVFGSNSGLMRIVLIIVAAVLARFIAKYVSNKKRD